LTVIFFLQLAVADFFVPFQPDLRHARPRLHDVGEHHAHVGGLFRRNADVVELSRAVKGTDVVLGGAGPVGVARLDPDVDADELLADRRRADKLDVHAVNFSAEDLRPGGLGYAEQQPGNQEAVK